MVWSHQSCAGGRNTVVLQGAQKYYMEHSSITWSTVVLQGTQCSQWCRGGVKEFSDTELYWIAYFLRVTEVRQLTDDGIFDLSLLIYGAHALISVVIGEYSRLCSLYLSFASSVCFVILLRSRTFVCCRTNTFFFVK